MLHERFADRFEDWLELIQDHQAVLGSSATGRIGSDQPREGFVGDPEAGLFCHPTIVSGVTSGGRALHDRDVRPARRRSRSSTTFDEAIALANDHGYGLSSAIYTNDPLHALRFRERVTRRAWSRSTTRPRAPRRTCPSAATASRATARASPGIWVLDQFTRWQSMNWDYAGKLQKAQMDVVGIEAQEDFRLEERAF